MTVRVGVIGTGVMGAEHGRLLDREISGAQVCAVFDIDTGRAVETAGRLRSARSVQDPFQLIADRDVDAVVVASSDATHEQFVLAAIAAGKPVLCEKPLAPEAAGCQRIIAAELAAGRRLVSVGFMRRFDPGYLQLKQVVDGGQFGLPLMLHCIHRNLRSPAGLPSSMSISGSAVHEFDIIRWLLEDELSRITVHRPRASRLAAPAADPLFLLVECRSGVLADIEIFLNSGYGYEVGCEVVAEHGTVSLDAPAPTVQRGSGGVRRAVAEDWRPRFVEAYRAELQNWIDSIEAGVPSAAASSWDGYAATVAAEAGIRALRSGTGQPVAELVRPPLYCAPVNGAWPAADPTNALAAQPVAANSLAAQPISAQPLTPAAAPSEPLAPA
jgi:myo-inositol 2-dehydrogenase / D-chiro-inositol 1-dehydrogenase